MIEKSSQILFTVGDQLGYIVETFDAGYEVLKYVSPI